MRLQIEVTSYCNMTCAMCPYETMTRKHEHMSWDTFTRVIDMAKSERAQVEWLHLYGEPLLWPHLVDGVKYMKEKGVNFSNISTNLKGYTPELGQALIDAGADMILACVDSMVPDTYKSMRVGGDLSKAITNATDLLHRAHHTATRVFIQRLESTLTTEKDRRRFQTAFGRDVPDGPVIAKDCGRIVQDRDFVVAEPRDTRKQCMMLEKWLNILANGTATACCWDYDGLMPLGNVFDSTLLQLWMGDRARKMRQDLHSGNYSDLVVCQTCLGEPADHAPVPTR